MIGAFLAVSLAMIAGGVARKYNPEFGAVLPQFLIGGMIGAGVAAIEMVAKL